MLTSLFVPGDRPDRFAKAVDSGADAVVIDLEDAVPAGHKDAARVAAVEFCARPARVPVHVRINAPGTAEADADLAALAGLPGLAGLRLPKVESPADVQAVAAKAHGADLYCLIESAVGVERAYAIATAHPAVTAIGLGEADLRADLNVTDDAGLAYARGRVVVAARAAGLPPPPMSVYPDVADLDGLAESCRAGRTLGFLGRSAIHPRQLPVIVTAFRPTPHEVALARTLLQALDEAAEEGRGVAVLPDGRFADRAMAPAARRTLDLAARYPD
ncbi:MAG TPA: CoA ester lyase [Rugosimonospora sp.]|jgi:citrate lyase subunit beta/citryl-CoA lyase